jgi:predicted ATPase
MKLSKVLIQNYRSIVDSGPVDIEEGVTVVIGKNEQGKTTFLRAIRSFNSDQSFSPSDLPNHLRPSLEEKPAKDIPIVTLWFGLEIRDKQKLKDIVENIGPVDTLKAVKYYSNDYGFFVIRDGQEAPLKLARPDVHTALAKLTEALTALEVKFYAHFERVPAFAANKEKIGQLISGVLSADLSDATQIENITGTFLASIRGLISADQPILDDITLAATALDTARSEILAAYQTDRTRLLKQSMPTFILHSTSADRIPNEVKIADFTNNPDLASRGMLNLCRAAGLTIQKIRELAATSDTAQRETYEDHYKATISGGLNEFWTQAEYNVHFRIDTEKLYVSISDVNYSRKIPPSDRSEGFQWYLSFYTTLQSEVRVSHQTALLLDNPGLELHIDGQRDIKRYLEERVAHDSQVIYVTHSPAMIDAFNLRQVRAVELQGNLNGTKINNSVRPQSDSDIDLLEPVRSAIGMNLAASLFLNDWNILVEGAADKPIVEGIFFTHYIEYQKKVLVNGSLAESKDAFLARFYDRTKLPYIVLLDSDSGGRDLFSELVRLGIPPAKIVKLGDVFPRKTDFATEDILSATFYHEAVMQAYPGLQIGQPAETAKKRCTAYEEHFKEKHGFGFSKRRVADSIKKLLSEHREDEATKGNLGKLSTAIVENLREQASTSGPLPISRVAEIK